MSCLRDTNPMVASGLAQHRGEGVERIYPRQSAKSQPLCPLDGGVRWTFAAPLGGCTRSVSLSRFPHLLRKPMREVTFTAGALGGGTTSGSGDESGLVSCTDDGWGLSGDESYSFRRVGDSAISKTLL